jgi:hypothetical protein
MLRNFKYQLLLFGTTISIPGSVRNNSAPSSFSDYINDRESHHQNSYPKIIGWPHYRLMFLLGSGS